MNKKVILAWSGGKDGTLALYALYEEKMQSKLMDYKLKGAQAVVFGDIFLEDLPTHH